MIWEQEGKKKVIKLSGVAGDRFYIESSIDLETWTLLGEVELTESTGRYELPGEVNDTELYLHAYTFNDVPVVVEQGIRSSSMVTVNDGGEVVGQQGSRLIIKPNSVLNDVEISISIPEQSDNQMQFLLEPEGLTFIRPVQFELPIKYDGDVSAFPWRFITSSDLNPPTESLFETTNWSEVNEVFLDTETGKVSIELDHFTFVYAASKIRDQAYLVFDIPRKYLLPGDILFTLTSFKQGDTAPKQPNWRPGHVGALLYPKGTGTSDPRSIMHADGERVKFDRIDGFRDLNKEGHLYLGARRPKGGLTKKERTVMVRILQAQKGKKYSKLGSKSDGSAHSCVSLIEYALDILDRGTLTNFQDKTIPTPYEMYIATQPVNEITVGVGENVEIPIYGAVVDPSFRIDTNTTGQGRTGITTLNEFYNRTMLFKELGVDSFYYEIDMDLSAITSSPNTFRRDHNPSYRLSFDGGVLTKPNGYTFKWKPEPKHAGKSFPLPVTLTAHPSFLFNGVRKQQKDTTILDTLTINVRPAPECVEEVEPNDNCQGATPMGDSKSAFGSIQEREASSRPNSPIIGSDNFAKTLEPGRYRIQMDTEIPTVQIKKNSGNKAGRGHVDFELEESENVCIGVFSFSEVESYRLEILSEAEYCESSILFKNQTADQTVSFTITADEIPTGESVSLAPGETFSKFYPHPLNNMNLIHFAIDGFLVGGDGNQQFQLSVPCGRTQQFVWSGFLQFDNTPLVDTEDLTL